MTTTKTTNRIPCGACNGSEYTGAGYTDSDHCDACTNGQAVCYCGELATAVECGDPVCAAHMDGETKITEMPCGHRAPSDPDRADWCSVCEKEQAYEEVAARPPADPGRTKRIPVQSMASLVYGGAQ